MYKDLPPELKNKLFFHNVSIICSELTTDTNITGVLARLLESLVDFFEVENGSFYLILDRKITSIAAIGESNIEIEIDAGDEKKLIAASFALDQDDLSFYPSLSGMNRVKLLVTINYSNNLLGFITLGAKEHNPFEESEKFILTLFANFIAKIIFHSNSYIKASGKTSDELYLKNITDILSGTYIKTYIEQRLNEGIKEAIRYKKPYSLSLVKLDKFSELRSNFGQQAVNTLIQTTGEIIRNLLRQDVDLAGKYTEDTFIILLPSTEKKGAVIFSERLKLRLSNLNIIKFPDLQITTSVGITSLEANDKNKDEVFSKLLSALEYSVKKGGNKLSFNYDGLITENLSDFEKATGMSAGLLKSAVENPFFLTDENGNEIDFTKPAGHWINIPKQH